MKLQYRPLWSWLLLLSLLIPLATTAQDMQVRSMALAESDMTANLSENLIQDNNGDYAGLVKVNLASASAEFEGLVLKSALHGAGEYWVFMAKNSYRLRVRVPGFLPLDVNFRDYGIDGIESRRTYVLTITMPQIGAVQQDDGMRYLAMTVEPKNSTVLVDNKPCEVKDGEVKVVLPMGSYRYQVMASGYAMQEGTVEVGDRTKPLEIRLASALSKLRVECATPGALIYVNEEQKGTTPWSGSLTSGNYKVEARLNGYRSNSQSITLGENENRKLTIPALQVIAGSINIDYSPIGAEVYVDGKNIGVTPGIFRDIPVGDRSVEIRKDGYETLKKTITIKENEQASLTGSLTAVSSSSSSSSSFSSSSSSSSPSSSKETFTVNGVSFTMVRVDGGTFTMGATEEQGSEADSDEKPTHQVTLSTYMIGETEVTQALWQAVMGRNPSRFTGDSSRPVESVSWNDCQDFIKKLNALTGKSFRLPTETEWEYAALGGSKSRHYKYAGGNSIDDVAWYKSNSGSTTHPVGKKSPNELDLYDMSGNVKEWCENRIERYRMPDNSRLRKEKMKEKKKEAIMERPVKVSDGVLRGGYWDDNPESCRYSHRFFNATGNRGSALGLRLAL